SPLSQLAVFSALERGLAGSLQILVVLTRRGFKQKRRDHAKGAIRDTACRRQVVISHQTPGLFGDHALREISASMSSNFLSMKFVAAPLQKAEHANDLLEPIEQNLLFARQGELVRRICAS